MRVLQGDERSDAGAVAPVARPRLVERLAASAGYPVTLLVAPAGYGKSVVLLQYLAGLREPCVRFALRSEHATLLSFLRGFAEALSDRAPHAITALAGAYERTTTSAKRSNELARWMHAHLEAFRGVIAIDDLHAADDDPEVAAFLSSLVERTKGRVRWILASRATNNLPVGTWLAYHDADLPLDEGALRFTLDEARSAAATLGLTVRDDELNELLALTEGWPAAMSFALRTSTRSSDLRNVSAITREMIYRFLAEQVYSSLDGDERALLEVAIALPAIDVAVLERAGFDRALPIVERLRARTAFIYEESPGVYQCHELIREFLRHESALGGRRSQQLVHEKAAGALEASNDIEHAIASYVLAGTQSDVVRLLEQHGFDMLERARGDVVARAIEALAEPIRRENATVLGLQGALQAIAGKFSRAESLLRRSLAKAGTNRDLVAIVSLRLASLIGNQGGDVASVLDPVANDVCQRAVNRAEAFSLIAARQAIAGDANIAKRSIKQITDLLQKVDSDIARAKILHHLGIVNRHVGDIANAFRVLTESSDLALGLHLYSVGSRANAVLSNLALHEEDDVDSQLRYAKLAAEAAAMAGDAFALRTASLQMLSAYIRRGELATSADIEKRLETLQMDEVARHYLLFFRSTRAAWEGHFGDAHRLMGSCWTKMHHDFDRISSGAQCALFLALDGKREASSNLIADILMRTSNVKATSLRGRRTVSISKAFCALAEAANGRWTRADRMVRGIKTDDLVVGQTLSITKAIIDAGQGGTQPAEKLERGIEKLATVGYGDVARLLRIVSARLKPKEGRRDVTRPLTRSEQEVLRLLANGLVPKEVAVETKRSVHTVRVHIANSIEKLGCHGQAEAIRRARHLDLI